MRPCVWLVSLTRRKAQLDTVKYVPDTPPAPVPGQVQQGGLAGPFVRSGRPPVDPYRPKQTLRRATFAAGPKQYRYGDASFRTDWATSDATGSTGTQKIAGASVLASLQGGGAPPPPPAGAPSGRPDVLTFTAAAPSSVAFVVDTPPDPSWNVYALLLRSNPVGYGTGPQVTPWRLVWSGGVVYSDLSQLYFQNFGALVTGYLLEARARFESGGVWSSLTRSSLITVT